MTNTTMSLHARPYHSEADYPLLRRLLVDILALTGPPVYATIGNLDWWRVAEEDPRSIHAARLWFDGPERLVAFAWPIDDQVDIIVHPDHPALHDTALAWAEEHFRLAGAEGVAAPFRAWAFTRDAARIAALEARGYRRTDNGLVVYGRPTEGANAPSLPPGYTLRHARGEAEGEARAAVQRAAFESEWMTAERHARVRHAPTYRPDLDIVAVAPDGELAGFALVWLDEANRLGVFEPLGVAAAYQRRGLGRALMLEGLRRLRDRGAEYALVETGLSYYARGLYETTGFELLDIDYAWTLAG